MTGTEPTTTDSPKGAQSPENPQPRRKGLKRKILAVAVVIAIAALYATRETEESMRETRIAVRKELNALPPAADAPLGCVGGYLENLAGNTSFRTVKTANFPWIKIEWSAPRVPYDYIAQLTEEQFIRFAGNGSTVPAESKCLQRLIQFSRSTLLPKCSEGAANSLSERSLDGMFLCGDFDSAIALLEGGALKSRSPGWCKSTAAKLRAHKAMVAGDKKEAVKQLEVFIEYMLSDEQKDFEDCDPTTRIVYSREWIAARNLLRCAEMARETGDTAAAAQFREKAGKLFAAALPKAEADDDSLKALKEEIKAAGL